ncbi:MAG: hypothetical protein GY810_20165 [Aureispira sp.]|nr:hypothetical protein [Aureispira sp.]
MKYLFPLVLLVFFACNEDKPQTNQATNLMQHLDINQLSTLNKGTHLHLLISFDYNKVQDSVWIKVGNRTTTFKPYMLKAILDAHRDSIDIRMRSKIRIALHIHQDLPFKYVEQVFNTLRAQNKRSVFLVADLQPQQTAWAGLQFTLPRPDATYDEAVTPFLSLSLPNKTPTKKTLKPNNSSNNTMLPPPPPLPPPPGFTYFKAEPIYYSTPITAIPILITDFNQVFLEGNEIKSLATLNSNLSKKIKETPPFERETLTGAIFSLDVSNKATYLSFLETFYALKTSHKHQLDSLALAEYNQPYDQLDRNFKRELFYKFPLNLIYLSQLEYNFLNKLKQENKLDSFVEENFDRYTDL